jgi:myosin heavy subunit
MKVLVSAAPIALWQSVAPQFALAVDTDCSSLLETQLKPVLVNQPVTTDNVAALLQQYSEIEIVVAYEGSELMLARLLDEGLSLEQALIFWQKNTEALLSLQQQHRRRLKLFNLHALNEDNSGLPNWLSAVYKKSVSITTPTISAVIAAQALRQNSQLKGLNQRLFASSLPLTEQIEPIFELALIHQQLAKSDELENTRSERDLILMQLQHVQEELEQLFHKKTEVKQLYESLKDDYQRDAQLLQSKLKDGENKVSSATKQLALLQAELERITAAHNNAHSELKQTSDERELLIHQLQHVQKELEKQHSSYTELQHKHQKLQNDHTNKLQHEIPQLTKAVEQTKIQLKQTEEENHLLLLQLQHVQEELEKQHSSYTELQHKHQKLQNDHTNKLQHEIPQLTKAVEQTKIQLKQTEEENHLLLLQLQHVQEELEHYYLKLQSEQQKNNHAATAKDKQQQRELSKLESLLRRTKAKAASAEHNTYLLQQELNAVKGSVLWKSGAPVRVLGRMVNKVDKTKQKLQRDTALILTSEYFDLEWYLATYPDVANGKINPAEHYLRFGAAEGRMPGPLFDGNWYLQRYPDVASANINPLLHFVTRGQQEGRSASPKLLTDNSQPKEE